MKIFVLYIRNINLIFFIIIIIISGYANTENVFYSLSMVVLIINVLWADGPITVGRGKWQVKNGRVYKQQFTVIDWLTKGGFICHIRV